MVNVSNAKMVCGNRDLFYGYTCTVNYIDIIFCFGFSDCEKVIFTSGHDQKLHFFSRTLQRAMLFHCYCV